MFRKILNKRNRRLESRAAAKATAHTLTDKAAMKIAMVIHGMQNGFANFLNKRTIHFSGRTWKILIIVFGACWGLFSLYVFSTALLPSEKSRSPVRKAVFPHLVAVPKRNDSLEYLEKVYDLRKHIQQQSIQQQRLDTMNKRK